MTVCAAVYRNLAVLAAEALAFTQALGRLGERGRAPAMRSAIDFAVLPSVSLALADTSISFSHSAILSAVDFAVLAAVALLVAANAPAIIRTRAVRAALNVIARCMAAFVKGELFAVPALLVAGRRAAHVPRECSCWRVVKALLWPRLGLGLGLLLLFC